MTSPLAFGEPEIDAAEALYAIAVRSEAAREAKQPDPADSLLHYEFRLAFDEEPDGSFTATLLGEDGERLRMEQADTSEDPLLEVMAHIKPPSLEVRRARRHIVTSEHANGGASRTPTASPRAHARAREGISTPLGRARARVI